METWIKGDAASREQQKAIAQQANEVHDKMLAAGFWWAKEAGAYFHPDAKEIKLVPYIQVPR